MLSRRDGNGTLPQSLGSYVKNAQVVCELWIIILTIRNSVTNLSTCRHVHTTDSIGSHLVKMYDSHSHYLY